MFSSPSRSIDGCRDLPAHQDGRASSGSTNRRYADRSSSATSMKKLRVAADTCAPTSANGLRSTCASYSFSPVRLVTPLPF